MTLNLRETTNVVEQKRRARIDLNDLQVIDEEEVKVPNSSRGFEEVNYSQ